MIYTIKNILSIPNVSCVYKIFTDKHSYIGSSVGGRYRLAKHFSELRRNIHPNNFLQRYYNKINDPENHFKIEILCIYSGTDRVELFKLEQEYTDLLKPDFSLEKKIDSKYNRGNGVNGQKILYQYDRYGNLINQFVSRAEGIRKLGFHIKPYREGAKQKMIHGFMFSTDPPGVFKVPILKNEVKIQSENIITGEIKEFPSIKECCIKLFPNLKFSTYYEGINSVLRGRLKTYKNYIFTRLS